MFKNEPRPFTRTWECLTAAKEQGLLPPDFEIKNPYEGVESFNSSEYIVENEESEGESSEYDCDE